MHSLLKTIIDRQQKSKYESNLFNNVPSIVFFILFQVVYTSRRDQNEYFDAYYDRKCNSLPISPIKKSKSQNINNISTDDSVEYDKENVSSSSVSPLPDIHNHRVSTITEENRKSRIERQSKVDNKTNHIENREKVNENINRRKSIYSNVSPKRSPKKSPKHSDKSPSPKKGTISKSKKKTQNTCPRKSTYLIPPTKNSNIITLSMSTPVYNEFIVNYVNIDTQIFPDDFSSEAETCTDEICTSNQETQTIIEIKDVEIQTDNVESTDVEIQAKVETTEIDNQTEKPVYIYI